MRSRFLAGFLLCALLAGCSAPQEEDSKMRILCTTYPVYLFTTAVTQGVEGVEVSLLVNAQTSCLHDYTLTVRDMKAIEGAHVIVMNGAGLEEFMEDALSHSDATVIDASEGIDLLESLEEEHHNHDEEEEEYDPHIWMTMENAGRMMQTIAHALADLDPEQANAYLAGYEDASDHLGYDTAILAALRGKPFITFHDGFQYFAQVTDLNLLKAIEEEEGAAASASEIKEIVALIEEYDIPAIFVEKNGSAATAEAIAAETGCAVYELDMIMSGDGRGIQPYITAMSQNLTTILEALK